MTDVKVLGDDEIRAAHTLFRAALHTAPADDANWELIKPTFEPGRTFGGYVDGELVGGTMSYGMPMAVPGGVVRSAAVTRVGVRADRTRRGVLSALMREQLAACVAAGEPVASLRASEYAIYGRFGYGVASRGQDFDIDPRRGAFHPAAPRGGDVRILARDELITVLPAVYERIGLRRAGMLGRLEAFWRVVLRKGDEEPMVGAVHAGPDGDDGFVVYSPEKNPTPGDPWGTALRVHDLHAANADAVAGLWRFVLGVDLKNAVKGWLRPLDEPLPLFLADPRAVRVTDVGDESWLRLTDVQAALQARSWAGEEAVVLRVRDAVLPANDGCYRVSPDGVTRVDDEPQLDLDVAALARLYLGDLSPSALAAGRLLTVADPAALPAADRLFATGTVPWSGTFF